MNIKKKRVTKRDMNHFIKIDIIIIIYLYNVSIKNLQ